MLAHGVGGLSGPGAEAGRARRRLRRATGRRRCRSSAWAGSQTGRDALELDRRRSDARSRSARSSSPTPTRPAAVRARAGRRARRRGLSRRRRRDAGSHTAYAPDRLLPDRTIAAFAKKPAKTVCTLARLRALLESRAMTATKTQAQAPLRSLDQRMEALKRANDIRVRRAQLKKDLKAGARPDRGDPQQPARVRRDREGLRHADGGAEVRAGEGGAVPEPVPDQPVEDGRRPLRPPARPS